MNKIEETLRRLCPEGVKMVRLGEVCEIKNGKDYKHLGPGNIPVYGSGGIMTYVDEFAYDKPSVLLPRKGSLSNVFFVNEPFWTVDTVFWTSVDENILFPKFFFHWMSKLDIAKLDISNGAAVPSMTQKRYSTLLIPLPPLEVQRAIADVLDKFSALEAELEAELDCRKRQYEYYRERLLSFEHLPPPEREKIKFVRLGEVLSYEQPGKYIVFSKEYTEAGTPVLTAGQSFILGYTNEPTGIFEASEQNPVIIFDDFTTSIHWVDFQFKVKSSAIKMLRPCCKDISFKYIYHAMECIKYETIEHSRQWISKYSSLTIPLPPLSEQKRIADVLDRFERLTSDLSEGLPAEIAARRRQYEHYRKRLLSFGAAE